MAELYRQSMLVHEPFMNMLRIFPTAQVHVKELIDVCRSIPQVERITIFGSALETRHNPWSDIDVFIEGVERKNFHLPLMQSKRAFDILTPDIVPETEPIYREIRTKGVVVYERYKSQQVGDT